MSKSRQNRPNNDNSKQPDRHLLCARCKQPFGVGRINFSPAKKLIGSEVVYVHESCLKDALRYA